MNKNLVIFIVIAIVFGAGGFFAGTKYQSSKTPNFNRQFAGQRTGNGNGMMQNGNRIGFRPVSGEITSTDANSITVKMQDGSSKIVLLTDATQINKAEAGAKTELQKGVTVAVFGQTNSDGSVTAQAISLNPMLRGPASSPTPTASPISY